MKEKEQEEEYIPDLDFHDVRKDWEDIKQLVYDNESDMEFFLKKQGVNASIRARNRLNQIRKLCIHLREGIFLQRQDNYSQYD